MIKRKILQEIKEYFKKNLPKSRLSEDYNPPEKEYFSHVLGVRKYALLLAKKYNADKFIIEAAALLHDIGADAGKQHADESARLADGFLSNLEISKETKDRILSCIKNHSMGSEAKNIEEQIIQDADGIIFIEESWKDFLYGYKDEMNLNKLKKFTISKVKGMMNKIKTEEGIKLANRYLGETLREIKNINI